MARPLPKRDCQSRSVSRMSSRMTRTAVEPGLVIGSQRARRIGSPRSRMRWIVISVGPFRSGAAADGDRPIWDSGLIGARTPGLQSERSRDYYYKVSSRLPAVYSTPFGVVTPFSQTTSHLSYQCHGTN